MESLAVADLWPIAVLHGRMQTFLQSTNPGAHDKSEYLCRKVCSHAQYIPAFHGADTCLKGGQDVGMDAFASAQRCQILSLLHTFMHLCYHKFLWCIRQGVGGSATAARGAIPGVLLLRFFASLSLKTNLLQRAGLGREPCSERQCSCRRATRGHSS